MNEKTEKPTPKKLKKAHERGERAHSTELASALILLGGVLLLRALAPLLDMRLKLVFTSIYTDLEPKEALERAFAPLVFPLLLFLCGIFLLAFLSHFFQIGWVWKRKKGREKGEFRLFYLPLKMAAIALIAFINFKKNFTSFSPFNSQKIALIFNKVYILSLEIALALVFLGICDFIYQKWKFYKKMHMTRQELKEEQREAGGNQATKRRSSN